MNTDSYTALWITAGCVWALLALVLLANEVHRHRSAAVRTWWVSEPEPPSPAPDDQAYRDQQVAQRASQRRGPWTPA